MTITTEQMEAMQASGYQSVWIVTGGGIGAVHATMVHPGASRFVLEVRIPYSADALEELIGEVPDSACSEMTVRALAKVAYERAEQGSKAPLGVACSAALATRRVRRGADRAWLCVQSNEKTLCYQIDVPLGSRSEQDDVVSDALLEAVATCIETT